MASQTGQYQFKTYNQGLENIDEYITELQYQIGLCEYGDTEETILCDRLVCGVRSNELRDKLLQTPNLSLHQCPELCHLSEYNSTFLANSTNRHGECEVHAPNNALPIRNAHRQQKVKCSEECPFMP